MDWIDISKRQPQARQCVLACFTNKHGHTWRVIADYIPHRTILAEDYLCEDAFDCEWLDYDQENECEWTPEGFYEFTYEGEINHFLSNPVTHWMPLPPKPRGT